MSSETTLVCIMRVRGPVGALAADHRARLESHAEDDQDKDAVAMLRHAARGRGFCEGRNGDLFSWGYVGNYSSIDSFVHALRPFWADAWCLGLMSPAAHVVVFVQHQDDVAVGAMEISLPRRFHGLAREANVTADDLCVYARTLGFPTFYDVECIEPAMRSRFDTAPKEEP